MTKANSKKQKDLTEAILLGDVVSDADLEMLRAAVTAERQYAEMLTRARGAVDFTKTHLAAKYGLSGQDEINLADGKITRK